MDYDSSEERNQQLIQRFNKRLKNSASDKGPPWPEREEHDYRPELGLQFLKRLNGLLNEGGKRDSVEPVKPKPVRQRERFEVEPAPIKRSKPAKSANTVYINRALLQWSCVASYGQYYTYDDRHVLTTEQWKITLAIVHMASAGVEKFDRESAWKAGAADMAKERKTKREIIRKWEHMGLAADIRRVYVKVGRIGNSHEFDKRRSHPERYHKTVTVETSLRGIAIAAGIDSDHTRPIRIALKRLQRPVETLEEDGVTKLPFPALLKSVKRQGSGRGAKVILEVDVAWFGSPAFPVTTPLIGKNSTALALQLMLPLLRKRRNDTRVRAMYGDTMVRRLNLPKDERAAGRAFEQALATLNKHLIGIGEKPLKFEVLDGGRYHFSR